MLTRDIIDFFHKMIKVLKHYITYIMKYVSH
jgi:hypothetical protein